MNYLMKKAVNLNGQDMMLAPLDIDFAIARFLSQVKSMKT